MKLNQTRESQGQFPIVGIGASAGGLEAVLELLKGLPSQTGMAFVLVFHLEPSQESQLASILSRVTALPVVQAVDSARVEADHVYVIPPNVAMVIENGELHLTPRDQSSTPHLQLAIRDSDARITFDHLPTVMADEIQLMRLLQNLVSNAIKYRGADPPRIHLAARDADTEWVFTVQDNGVGIDPKYADQIFTVFKRLHGREYPGTGIGLAICKKVVERHGGHIWVESKPGQGASFYFTLPKTVRLDTDRTDSE
jgi:signal transduction histidine kinase